MKLLKNIHDNLKLPFNAANSNLIRGDYEYYHYLCDGIDDRGWGCGYRTLQTICSWVREQQRLKNFVSCEVPSINSIQKALVDIGDKNQTFIGSKCWIGSVEVAYVIDNFYQVQSKIVHCRSIADLSNEVENIKEHFKRYGSPIMMGGDNDCSSKGLLGVCDEEDETCFLILDPHFYGSDVSKEKLQENGWIKWQNIKSFDHSSFYNLCCPLIEAIDS